MGIIHDKYRKKVDTAYEILGIAADVAQLGRALLRNEIKGKKQNITTIIKKLEKIKNSL